ncbi:esterase [Methylomarinum sp. Ch1-1]|uniref:Esterase n=1 Tax=Methylomarinum roseum TaxID=3067653 RepID=A0AAU7NSQ9_9GAMM|nr:esterase [Methylomarinum sp. Ch1-1]MDP4519986.1 esterase [Methylomarinum sp. Ch1-1]
MTLPRHAYHGLIFLLALLLMGCAPNIVYRSDYASCTVTEGNACETHAIQIHHAGSDREFQLGFVEIDDQGLLRDRKQLYALLDRLYATASKDNLLINVFVHGWHHNAAPGDSNIEGFKDNLAKLGQIESLLSQNKKRQARKVIGIYVGWRGESIDFPGLRHLTFWDRKNTAEDVGYLGISELLLKLEQITHIKNSQQDSLKSRLIIIGHSFGGAVVYNAAAQILASRFVNSKKGKSYVGSVEGFGDLVVLLNPAFEALQFAPLYDLAQSRCSYPFSKQPRLAVLTSETDYASKYAFWVGRVFSSLFESHKTIVREECDGKRKLILDEGEADRNTIGHFPPLITHRLTKATNGDKTANTEPDKLSALWRRQWQGATIRYGAIELTDLEKTAAYSPYLNIEVSEEIMDGHNDIFTDDLMEFIRMLIVLSAMTE